MEEAAVIPLALLKKKSKIDELKQNFEKTELPSPRTTMRTRRKKLEDRLEEKDVIIQELSSFNEELQRENKRLKEQLGSNNNLIDRNENSKKNKRKQNEEEEIFTVEELANEVEILLEIGEFLKERLKNEKQLHVESKKTISEQHKLITHLKLLLSNNSIEVTDLPLTTNENKTNHSEMRGKGKKISPLVINSQSITTIHVDGSSSRNGSKKLYPNLPSDLQHLDSDSKLALACPSIKNSL